MTAEMSAAFVLATAMGWWTPASPATPDPRSAMVDALQAPGPHPSLGEEARLFDRFVGTWDCDYATFPVGGPIERSTGEVIFGWVLDGRALQDIWITDPSAGATEREIGTTIRFYDTKQRQWRVVWMDPVAGRVTTLSGGAEGDRIVLQNREADGSARRWSFNDIRADSFVWRGERSRDSGRTWRLEAEYHLKRRPSAGGDPRRDMITILPASAPHRSLPAAGRIFDRFVGRWECDFTTFASDGAATRFSGEVLFGRILDGRAVQDIWIGDSKDAGRERTIGTTVRFFDVKTGFWRVIFIAPAAGTINVLEGGTEGDRIVLKGTDTDGSLLRWSFNEIRPDSFLWRGETSRDGGKTWRLEEEHRMRRTGAAPVSSSVKGE